MSANCKHPYRYCEVVCMPVSDLRLIKNSVEYLSKDELHKIPKHTRGIYVLYKRRGRVRAESHHYDFVYVGIGRGKIGVKARLGAHRRHKGDLWTHFSVFEVWENIRDEEIAELEGLFRHLYQYDSKANSLNKQKGYRPLNRITRRTKKEWL